MFQCDVAISFAGEQRTEAEAIAACLTARHAKVFYDRYEQADLWGKDLYEHLAGVYQNGARYCLMLVSAAYAEKAWTTHERRSAQARALSQKTEYILPVRFDDTEIPGLLPTVSYLRFQDHGVQGICSILLEKLGSSALPEGTTTTRHLVASEPPEFFEQRRKLPDTEILKKVWSKPRWRIAIRPTEFKRARFRDVEQCREFVMSSYVRVQGWFPYPWFVVDKLETGTEWIAGEIEKCEDGRISHFEHWVLFRSGLFAHNLAFDEIPQHGKKIHVFEILDTTTAAFEFAARMAGRSVLSPEAVVCFELHKLDGRELVWPKDIFGGSHFIAQNCWCQEESFEVARQVPPAELQAKRREFAIDVALEIYAKFGWSNPPRALLVTAQGTRFGSV
jgi:hypothetical protein